MQTNSGPYSSGATGATSAAPQASDSGAMFAGSSPDMERLTRDFRAFLADCETLLRNAQTLSGEGAAVARTEFTRKLADARVRLDSMKTSANQQAMRAREMTEDYVRREPMKALAIAAGTGALVALIVSRR